MVYNEFITQLQIYAKVVRILAKEYLPVSLITLYKLQEIFNSVKETLIKNNPDWERLRLRASDYKNNRIFTLRCLHKDLVPVNIKLKSILTTFKARQIIRKAEKDLLQARVKAINNILDQVAKQTEDCRTQLA